MAFQRCFLQISKQYMLRPCLPQANIKQTYCTLELQGDILPRKYSNRHEWIIVDQDIGTVGLSKYAQESLGDVVFAQLPEPKTIVKEGEECGTLESVKAASEIYSPVSGVITEKNVAVENKPALINTNYYDSGWLFKLEVKNPSELNRLMSEAEYQKFLKTDAVKPVETVT